MRGGLGRGGGTPARARTGRRVLPVVVIVGIAAGCSSSGHASSSPSPAAGSSTSGTASAAKSAFCSANDSLDRAQAGSTSDAQEMQVLKQNTSAIATFDREAPQLSDPTVSAAAAEIYASVEQALSTGTPTFSAALSQDGGTVDTFCGVQSDGTPLPAYFDAGKAEVACRRYASLNDQLQNADSAPAYLSLLAANQAEIATLVAQAPASVAPEAQALGTAVQAAISQNSIAPLQTAAATQDTSDVQLYCGINY